ncbi:hypothetical protein P8C59_000427 [Phyllachora maydis]|uniref:Uncharacterized protein n=1 Tax=Phyllachora maydis TaxID=1825666 RepID=A0AAD9HX65_9PEZI|nr:hypothetical protein P8C59_000427 [Phyllachora maydis]
MGGLTRKKREGKRTRRDGRLGGVTTQVAGRLLAEITSSHSSSPLAGDHASWVSARSVSFLPHKPTPCSLCVLHDEASAAFNPPFFPTTDVVTGPLITSKLLGIPSNWSLQPKAS